MSESRACPRCQTDNLPQRRFCAWCGVAFEVRCPSCARLRLVGDEPCCGSDLLAAWRPLGGDGAPAYTLPPGLASDQERLEPAALTSTENRAATIVKADLSGFTAMSELLGDPEEVTVIMNQVFEPLVACVRRYGGHIDNYAGDMIISFFGAPTAHEGDAERAVRAAIHMRAEVAGVNARDISHGVDLGISTGVASGRALWGEVGAGSTLKQTLSGELGDFAALLEKYADRGTVGVCPLTQTRIGDALALEVLAQQVLPPGEDHKRPMAYAELRASEPTWAESAAGHGPWQPTAWLAPLAAALQRGQGGLWLLRGPAGSGKSRALYEFTRTTTARVHAVGGRPLSAALGDDGTLALAASLHTAPDDLAEALTAAAAQGPTLVLLDGLDWLPDWPREVLQELSADGWPAGLVVVLAARDGGLAAHLRAEGLALTELEALPLPRAATLALAADTAGRALGGEEEAWVWAQSGGNPLLAREFAAVLDRREELPWRVAELVGAALDTLDVASRAVLAVAAALADDAATFDPRAIGLVLALDDWSARLERLETLGFVKWCGGRLALTPPALRRVCLRRLVDSVRLTLTARGAAVNDRLVNTR